MVIANAYSLAQSYRHCRELTRREARNFYYGFILLPSSQRRAMYSSYAFSRICDDIVDDEGKTSPDKREDLNNFRRELDLCLQGQPEGPVFPALRDAIQRFQIPTEYFHQILDGVEMDLDVHRYSTFEQLKGYCHLVASIPGLVTIEICGYQGGEEARLHATELGIAMQLTNIIRDIREDANRDHIYLPEDEMRAFGYSEEELMAGLQNEAFYRLMDYQVQRAMEYFRLGRQLLPLVPRRSRACVAALANIYQALLGRIVSRHYDVFQQRVTLNSCQKIAVASRALARSMLP